MSVTHIALWANAKQRQFLTFTFIQLTDAFFQSDLQTMTVSLHSFGLFRYKSFEVPLCSHPVIALLCY